MLGDGPGVLKTLWLYQHHLQLGGSMDVNHLAAVHVGHFAVVAAGFPFNLVKILYFRSRFQFIIVLVVILGEHVFKFLYQSHMYSCLSTN